MNRSIRIILLTFILLVLAGLTLLCWQNQTEPDIHQPISSPPPTALEVDHLNDTVLLSPTPTHPTIQEISVTVIPLSGPASESRSEISGMAWYGDTLILLPQYPGRFGQGDGVVFGLAKEQILTYLDGKTQQSLTPLEITFNAPGIESLEGFQGFEAIAFVDNHAYLTIEAKPDEMMGYLITGEITSDLSELRMDPQTITEIPPPTQIENMTDEAILIVTDQVLTFFEANGIRNNSSPIAHVFSPSGDALGSIPMTNLEYRLTDVTLLDGFNRFWGINYFFPGDEKLTPDNDPLVTRFGEGPSHSMNTGVERLVEFEYSPTGVTLTDTPPIQIQLLGDDQARNWEGIVRLDQRGFLLATDKFPQTIFAFVPYP